MTTLNFTDRCHDQSGQSDELKQLRMSTTLSACFATFASVIFVFTVVGNLLVLCFKARLGRKNTTLLVWNLGLTDFLVGICVLPLGALHVLLSEWKFSQMVCRLWVAADVTFCTCSVVTICVISVDRYIAVTRPLRYKSMITRTRVITIIIIIWCFSVLVLLATVKWDQPNCENSKICFVGDQIRYLAHSVIFAFFIPASVTLTLYWKIYRLARNRQRALDHGFVMTLDRNFNFLTNKINQKDNRLRVHFGGNEGMVEHQKRMLRTHERIAKTLGVVSCSFLFCWLPFFTLYLINNSCQCISLVIIDFASWLGYCNSMLNPIIYSFTMKEFKQSTLNTIAPIWRITHRCLPCVISKPPPNLKTNLKRRFAYQEPKFGSRKGRTIVFNVSSQQ